MSEPAPSRPSVLLLDDEASLRSVVCDNLGDEFEIETAVNADEALLLLGTRRFDILLSDQMLPGKLQGLDFLMRAMEQQPEARRILITGYLNPELLARSVGMAKLSACLIKPVDMGELRKTLRSALTKPVPV